MSLDYVHLFNIILCYAPYSVSFLWNFACLTSNFVSVIDLQLGLNFHTDEGYEEYYEPEKPYTIEPYSILNMIFYLDEMQCKEDLLG